MTDFIHFKNVYCRNTHCQIIMNLRPDGYSLKAEQDRFTTTSAIIKIIRRFTSLGLKNCYQNNIFLPGQTIKKTCMIAMQKIIIKKYK